MMDTIMVASVGEAGVSAVSLVDSIMILIIQIFAAIATGGAVVAGQFLGAKDEDNACSAANQLVLFIAVLSVGVMALVYLLRGFILHQVFGQISPEVMAYCSTYLDIVSLSIPFIALYNGGAALFRTMGNSKISMYTSLLMNAINVVGNAILIYGFKMEVAGAAIPTLFSRIVAAVVMIALLRNPKLLVHLKRPFALRFNGGLIKRILYIGVPNGLENSMFQLGKNSCYYHWFPDLALPPLPPMQWAIPSPLSWYCPAWRLGSRLLPSFHDASAPVIMSRRGILPKSYSKSPIYPCL